VIIKSWKRLFLTAFLIDIFQKDTRLLAILE
jgi:hypothetical protein